MKYIRGLNFLWPFTEFYFHVKMAFKCTNLLNLQKKLTNELKQGFGEEIVNSWLREVCQRPYFL
jgi:hypothetical protein